MTDALSVQDKKVIYRARRGLKELDFYIDPYIKQQFLEADSTEKAIFARLVEEEDPDLLNWFMGVEDAPDAEIAALITKIRSHKIFE